MNRKKRIAIITTWFPPKNGVAVNRMHAFAKYLSGDYEIEVFTEGDKTHSIKKELFTVHFSSSKSFLNNIKHQTDDSRVRHSLISLINVTKGILGYSTLKKWKKETLSKLTKSHKEHPFDLIVSSYAPVETHNIAIDFKKINPEVLWIADMRDEMSKNPNISKVVRSHLVQEEILVNRYADALTTVSMPILNDFKKIMSHIHVFEEIRNGFDHDFKPVKWKRNHIFTIGYVGMFYGEITPKTFFEAVSNLMMNESIEIKIVMVGTHKTFYIPKYLESAVEIVHKVPYQKAIEIMASMDVNLLVHPSGKRKGVYTGKLFDYISVGKPVIGVIDKDDVAAELIQKYNCGYIADFYNVDEIESILLQAHDDWKNGIVRRASEEEIAQLHRKNEVKKLAKLIEQLTEQ